MSKEKFKDNRAVDTFMRHATPTSGTMCNNRFKMDFGRFINGEATLG